MRRLHWLMALLLPSMVGFGLYFGSLARGSAWKALLLDLHAVLGLLLFVLALTRLWVRHRLAAQLPESAIARFTHRLFYGLMLVLPLLGLGVWASDPFVGGPALLGRDVWVGNLAERLHQLHYLGAWLLLLTLLAHVAGAFSRSRTGSHPMTRMLPPY
ncbi:MAG: cytochrome b/b6 domain-containing protein [Xanthomonadaceae bacterium]|nr:cytochrome b/b6 domain-containing protein [Xanthomonadaceae bacterium]